ncbi:MAG: cysteine desulfurase NifS [bacterium]
MKRIYLDHNAATPVRTEVKNAMVPLLTDNFGNASSVHHFGQAAQHALEDAREKLARLINAEESTEIVFTSGGTESDNLAIIGAAESLKNKGNHIITSSIEHHAVLNSCAYLHKHRGCTITYLPCDQYGRVSPADLQRAITNKTILASIIMANNEVGTIQPIEELARICKEKNIVFHTDAVQAGGKLPINMQKLSVDMLSLSAHKFYGPKGTGMLYIKKGIHLVPLLHGGHHERNRRAGTENIAGIVGMAKALELSAEDMLSEENRIRTLRDKLQKNLMQKIPYAKLNGHPEHRLSNTLNISFEFIEGEGIILSMDIKGLAVSTGSACTSGTLEPSHVLKAMGVPIEAAHGSIRFSLGRSNSASDIDYVIKTMPGIIEKLRSISPLWEDKQKGVETAYTEDSNTHH